MGAGGIRRAGQSPSLASAIGTAMSLGSGVGVGVLLGAYLTAVSGAGAPGAISLDSSDLVVLPLLSGVAVALAVLAALRLAGVTLDARERRQADRDHQ